MPAAEAEAELAVDDVVHARLEVGEDRRPLGRGQPAVVAAAIARSGPDADQRHLARLDPLFQVGGPDLGDGAGLDGRVDAVLERLPQRRVELVGADAELLGGVRDDRVALLGGGELRRGDGRSSAEDGRECGGAAGELELPEGR